MNCLFPLSFPNNICTGVFNELFSITCQKLISYERTIMQQKSKHHTYCNICIHPMSMCSLSSGLTIHSPFVSKNSAHKMTVFEWFTFEAEILSAPASDVELLRFAPGDLPRRAGDAPRDGGRAASSRSASLSSASLSEPSSRALP